MNLTDMLIDAATSGADVEIKISYFYHGLDFDKFIDILSNYEFKSYVDYDKSICLSFSGKERKTEVKNESSKIEEYNNPIIKDYLGSIVKLRLDLENFLIKDFTSAPTFEKFLHLVRFYQVKNINLLSEERITFKLDYSRFYEGNDDEANLDYDNSWYNVPFKKDFILESFLGQYISYDNHIEICPENIEYDLNNRKSSSLFNLYKDNLLAKVLYHEYGHAIFLYDGEVNGDKALVNSSTFMETEANYFPSYVFKGEIDNLILDMCAHQPVIYRHPMFYSSVKDQYSDFMHSDVRKLYVHDGAKGSDLFFPKPPVLKPIMLLNKFGSYATILKDLEDLDAYGTIYPTIATTKVKNETVKVKTTGNLLSKAMQAKEILMDLANSKLLREIDVECLKDAKISKALFDMNYPILVLKDKLPSEFKDRYQIRDNNIIVIMGNEYYFTNDWSKLEQVEKLAKWARIIKDYQPKF